ncbi:hypothetical protein GE061_013515 [Apolygus lucorum]|uniref:Uncharacterized protein n=1 Tax=Apolygus lucorum TaxID=248454 RepID=A0A6A4K5P0_APOLU|nr:hypothetical protein GE061_013515 [Apolygus lucorum]
MEQSPIKELPGLPDRRENQLPLPSPFKRAFVYPEPGPLKKSRKRELFPSVITYQPWIEYHEKKAKKKLETESKKQERAMERQRKKAEKELSQIRKKEEKEKREKEKAMNRKENTATRKRNTQRRKQKLPSSSESEDRVSSISDDDHESDVEVAAANFLQPPLCSSDNPDPEDVEQNEIVSVVDRDEGIINQIFCIDGLDIEPGEYKANVINDLLGPGQNLELGLENKIEIAQMMISKSEKCRNLEDLGLSVGQRLQEIIPQDLRRISGKNKQGNIGEQSVILETRDNITVTGECNSSVDPYGEGDFIVARFNKNKGVVEHVCKIISKYSDDELMVGIMNSSSRIGRIFNEDGKDVRKIKYDQIVKKLSTPRRLGSKFQFENF